MIGGLLRARAVRRWAPHGRAAARQLLKVLHRASANPVAEALPAAIRPGRYIAAARLWESGLLDRGYYLREYPELIDQGVEPLLHYLDRGVTEGRRPNPLFDTTYYLEQNPELAEAGINPLIHFFDGGAAQGCNPCADFDVRIYLARYPDVEGYGRNPLVHYLQHGRSEGRDPTPLPTTYACAEALKTLGDPATFIGRVTDAFAGALPEAPEVSVVVPVHNHVAETLRCLVSLAASTEETPFEVIVVDDASTDETAGLLGDLQGLVYRRNEENIGFLRSCNRGAAAARGRFIHLLNNDTVVLSGWLDGLVGTFEKVDGAGLVGSKLIYPDGRLQEAGGIIWRDGDGCNYGRGGDPDRPDYNYLRDVDYCSAASILVPAHLWRRLGGFDERYTPAYYEDTDLAFRIREHGLRTLYQPLSTVIHFEGVSSGTDVKTSVKAYQVRNRERFEERWRSVLAAHGTRDADREKDRAARARALVLDATTPAPDQDSGSNDMVMMLDFLQRLGCQCTFAPLNLVHLTGYTEALQRMGVECLYAPYVRAVGRHLETEGRRYDLVILSRAPVASDMLDQVLRYCPDACVVFNTVDLHYLREMRRLETTGSIGCMDIDQLKRNELDVVRRSHATLVVSETERELLAGEVPGAKIHWFPLIRHIAGRRRPFQGRRDLLFVGSFLHPPNVDAITHFVGDTWPLVRACLPGVRLFVIGSRMPDEIRALKGDGVEALGFVEDLDPLLDGCRVLVAPLRYGAGSKGKVLLGLTHGVPQVVTPVAMEGMGLVENEHVLVGRTPETFADAVARLYEDEALWTHLSDAGLDQVRRCNSIDVGLRQWRELLSELGCPVSPVKGHGSALRGHSRRKSCPSH